MTRLIIKRIVQGVFLVVVFPAALLSGFGSVYSLFLLFAHAFAVVPGFPGQYCRAAYYRLTLRQCSQDVAIGFGSFFVKPAACVAPHVSIGAYCVIGMVNIGSHTQIASHVDIPSGRHQHIRSESGKFAAGKTEEELVEIGSHCWIGGSCVVLANVGSGSTIGAGAVVVKDIPESVVAVGNPAKVIKAADSESAPVV